MITGVVSEYLEATIRLVVLGPQGQEEEIKAVIDTGFTEFLTLPPRLIHSLGLPWNAYTEGFLGDGSSRLFDVYLATAIWDGRARVIPVEASDTDPLLGMKLIHRYDLRIQAVEGGVVTLSPLS